MRRLFNRYLVFLVACSLPALLALLVLAEPVHAAPPAQASGAYGVAQYDQVNVRTGPSTAYPTVGQMSLGQSCPILGRDTYSGWYLLQCSPALTGWVAPELIAIVGNPATIPLYSIGGAAAPPEQQVPPPPVPFAGWKASYFANRGSPGVARVDPGRAGRSTSTGAMAALGRRCRTTISRRATSAR